MAKKRKIKTDNFKPPAAINKVKTISAGGVSISDIIKNVYNEVGHSGYSTLTGTDSNGIPLRAITNAEADPLMMRYEYPNAYATTGFDTSNDEVDYANNSLSREYYYQQDTKTINEGKKVIRRFEKKGRPYITYDEEYFNHIFNWPTSHTLVPRKLGGFVQEVVSCTTTTTNSQTGQPSTSTTSNTTIYPVTTTFTGSMTLDKVDSKMYYINDDWTYTEIPFHTDGTINSEVVTDRLGKPVIYHGDSEDDGIFFNYVVDDVDVNEVATSNLMAMGDTVNGATVTNVVNFLVDTAIKRTVSKHPGKGSIDVDITESQFLALDSEYTSADYAATKSWLKLTAADGIAKGNTVRGRGIKDGTYVTGVDESRNRVYISDTLSEKKVKLVRFFDGAINKVNKSTLCYAKVSGGTFTADTNYAVTRNGQSTGVTICVKAGKGITNRSAVVGIYFTKDKKEIEYAPIFYRSDSYCEKSTITDSNGTYILGTVIWNDNTRLESKFLLTKPEGQIPYTISSTYLAFTNAPIDKETLEEMVNYYNETNDMLKLYRKINDHVKTVVGGRRAAGVFDDICRDELSVEYTLAYNPFVEVGDIVNKLTQMDSSVRDECLSLPSPVPATSIDDAKKKFKDIIDNSVKNSIVLPDDYYKKLVSDKDSLLNRLTDASKLIQNSTPKTTKVDSLPPPIEGEDSSGVRWMAENFRDLPPAMDRVKYFVNDISLASDKDLDPSMDLDPSTTKNQPKIVMRSKPCWNWSGTPGVNTFTISVAGYTAFTASILVTVNVDTNGYLTTITTSPGSITLASETITSGDTVCTITRSWIAPSPKDANDNIVFGEKAKTYEQGGYISATNWTLPPDLRDLDNKERDENSDISNPTASIFPKQIWAPNVNYQMDYHKMFSFRTEEVSELLGETIVNYGNPYADDPIRAKLTKTIKPEDTTIHVQSTDGFLSCGYLIIPKYTKKMYSNETGNVNTYFTYCGEEIIYYQSKTNTTFVGCERELFGTTSDFVITVPSYSLEQGVRYKITSLGNTNWKSVGAGDNPTVGTIFTATASITGTGSAEVLGSTEDETPDEPLVAGVESPDKIPVMTSYEYGFSISQHWIFTLMEG